MSLEQAWDKLRQRANQPLTEVHIVNGLNPHLPFSYYTDLLRGFKRIRPGIHLKCFTAVEIAFFADLYGMTDEQVLRELMDAGLDSLPGGGAEIFARARAPEDLPRQGRRRSLSRRSIASRIGLGLRTNVTMLYGHIETMEERVDHMLRARALQDETGGFQAFIPLAFHPDNNQMRKLPAPTGTDTLRVHAVSRLMLDNIPHIKAFWIATGLELAQTALWFGVDDLDGTVQEEKIYHMAGSPTPEGMTTAALTPPGPRRRPRAARARHASTTSSTCRRLETPRARLTPVWPACRASLTSADDAYNSRQVQILQGESPAGGLGFFTSGDCEKFHKVTSTRPRRHDRDAVHHSAADRVREGAHLRAPGAAREVSRPVRRRDGGAALPRRARRSASKLVILGHHYQRDEVIRFADYTGDSFRLARQIANRPDADYIVFCGVHFMAESADVLCAPHQQVILPDLAAGCSMADMAEPDQLETCWEELTQMGITGVVPVTYINSAASIKAFVGERGGTVCTSSNATATLKWAFERGERVLFLPDQHLGRNTAYKMGIPLDEMVGVGSERDLRRPRRPSRRSARR